MLWRHFYFPHDLHNKNDIIMHSCSEKLGKKYLTVLILVQESGWDKITLLQAPLLYRRKIVQLQTTVDREIFGIKNFSPVAQAAKIKRGEN